MADVGAAAGAFEDFDAPGAGLDSEDDSNKCFSKIRWEKSPIHPIHPIVQQPAPCGNGLDGVGDGCGDFASG